jgi:hypothetical protein
MVVGTEHKGHFVSPGYPLRKLEALLDAYRPDLVLVEIRPEAFALGHYEDGPIEMSYVVLLAKRRGIPVAPIDWYRDEDMGKDPPVVDADGDRTFERDWGPTAERLDSYAPFDVLNSPARAHAVLELRNAQTRLGSGEGVVWERRQAWFNHLTQDAIESHHARRALAFVGFAHRPELEASLVASGLVSIDPRSIRADALDAPVDDEVIAFWKSAIERMRARATATSNPAVKRALEAKIVYWQAAVDSRGRMRAHLHE